MQCEKFRTDEIISSLEVCWKLHREKTIVVQEFRRAPLLSPVVVVLFEDFKPAVSCGIVVCSRIVNLLHVDGAGAHMALVDSTWLRSIRPNAIVEGDLRASICGTDTGHSFVAIDATCHIISGNAVDRIRGLAIVIAHANASSVALRGVIDVEVSESGMTLDSL